MWESITALARYLDQYGCSEIPLSTCSQSPGGVCICGNSGGRGVGGEVGRWGGWSCGTFLLSPQSGRVVRLRQGGSFPDVIKIWHVHVVNHAAVQFLITISNLTSRFWPWNPCCGHILGKFFLPKNGVRFHGVCCSFHSTGMLLEGLGYWSGLWEHYPPHMYLGLGSTAQD